MNGLNLQVQGKEYKVTSGSQMSLRPQHKHHGNLSKDRFLDFSQGILIRLILGGASKSARWTHTHCDDGLELDVGTKEQVYLDYSC